MSAQQLDPEAVRLGATIRALREAHGLKITELASAIGVSRPYLTNIEHGRKKATRGVCRKTADTLGIPLAAITIEDYEAIKASA